MTSMTVRRFNSICLRQIRESQTDRNHVPFNFLVAISSYKRNPPWEQPNWVSLCIAQLVVTLNDARSFLFRCRVKSDPTNYSPPISIHVILSSRRVKYYRLNSASLSTTPAIPAHLHNGSLFHRRANSSHDGYNTFSRFPED